MAGIRSYHKALILIIAIVVLGAFSAIAPSFAQHAAAVNASDSNIVSLPVSFVIDNAMNAQMQDIQENIFEYKFQAANNDTAAQEALVNSRSRQLNNDVASNEMFLNALISRNVSIPGSQLAALADQMNVSLGRMNKMSMKLQEHAAGLSLVNGHSENNNSAIPLISEINNTMALDQKVSQVAMNNIVNKGHGPLNNDNHSFKKI